MIIKSEVAKVISDLMIDCGGKLDESVSMVRDNCSPEEFRMYRTAIGKVMGEILLEVLNPLYKLHPDIKPTEMK